MSTVQAPHWAMPQPNLVPVSFNESRRTHSKGISGSRYIILALPLTMSEIDMALSPRLRVGASCKPDLTGLRDRKHFQFPRRSRHFFL
jgi:hypothetical protein